MKTIHTGFKTYCLIIIFLVSNFWFALPSAHAQTYCTPTVTPAGFYISSILFNYQGSGNVYNTGNGGASFQSTSAKNIPKYYTSDIWLAATSNLSSLTTVHVTVFGDWNGDGDFTDAYEKCAAKTLVTGISGGTNLTIIPHLNTPSGSARIRVVLSQNMVTDPCAPVVGEVEDYMITIRGNTAPVLNTSAVPFLNPLLTTQTASDGFTINQLVTGAQPAATLIADADDSSNNYVPRGIAITDASGNNGYWQYRLNSASAWTNLSGVSAANALLLLGDGAAARYQQAARLRFVPSGVATPTLTFRAWDGTSDSSGAYVSLPAGGDSSAFSTVSATVSMQVLSNTPSRHFYIPSNSSSSILSSPYDPLLPQAYSPSVALAGDTNLTNITDLDLDAANSRLIWTESAVTDKIVASNLDGSNRTILRTFPSAASNPNGIATGGGFIYYTDNGSGNRGIYRMDMTGAGHTALTGGSGQLPAPFFIKDVEYYNGKLYVAQRRTLTSSYTIYQLGTNGQDTLLLVSSPNELLYLEVVNGNIYWTERTNGSSVIYAKPLAGGPSTLLATGTDRQYRDMKADSANSRLYFIDNITSATRAADRWLCYIPLAGGTPTRLLSLPGSCFVFVPDLAVSPLPVSLTTFSGQALITSNLLQWIVADNDQNSRYTLESSADGHTFLPLTTLNGSDKHQYDWHDYHPAPGASYYRLQMQGADGDRSFSKTIAIRRSGAETDVRVHPNPAKDELTVTGGKPEKVELFNALGQRLMAVYDSQQLSIKQLPEGIYSLRITLMQTHEVINRRIVKQ